MGDPSLLTLTVRMEGAVFVGGGDDVDPDLVPGFFEWAAEAGKRFRLLLYSPRVGNYYTSQWLLERWQAWQRQTGREVTPVPWRVVNWLSEGAWLMIDTRCLQFRGDWGAFWLEPERLTDFKQWNEGQEPCKEAQADAASRN